MQLPLQITFRNMKTSPSVEAHIHERAEAAILRNTARMRTSWSPSVTRSTRRDGSSMITRAFHGDKAHEIPRHGRVARLFEEKGYGIIRSSEGDEIYMHPNAVTVAGFDAVGEGDEVRYVPHESEEDKGPQASTVTRIGKHYLAPCRLPADRIRALWR